MNPNRYVASPLRMLRSTMAPVPVMRSGYIRKYLSFSRAKWGRVAFVRETRDSTRGSSHLRLHRVPTVDEKRVNIYWRSGGGYKPLFVYGYSRPRPLSWGRALKRRHDRSIGFPPLTHYESAVSQSILLYAVYTLWANAFFFLAIRPERCA